MVKESRLVVGVVVAGQPFEKARQAYLPTYLPTAD